MSLLHIVISLQILFLTLKAGRYLAHLARVGYILRKVPGPSSPSLLWGQEWLLYHTTPGSQYAAWHRHFGKVVKFSGAFGHQILSITDPRAINYILGEGTYSFPKPEGVREWFKATLGEGIIWVEGKGAHERQKRSLAPTLSPHAVREMTGIMYENAQKLVSQWTRQIEGTACDEAEIEVTNWASRFALDTVGRAAFSHDFDCLSGAPHSLVEALEGLTNNENTSSSFYMRALFWIFPSILRIGKKGQMIKQSKRELGDIAIRVWKDAQIAGDAQGRNVISSLLRADATDGDYCMSEEQVVAQMRTTISAGYETVSAVIAWMLYELATNPAIQAQLREEILAAGDPTFDDLNTKMPFLDAVWKETLRLHPPILENHHQAAETISVPLSEPIPGTSESRLVIPKGTIIAIPLNVVQSDPEIFHDEDQFWPQRWLDSEQKSEYPSKRRNLLAFSEGPRSCIGKVFAATEIKILMVVLLRQFSFSLAQEVEPFQSFVIRPRVKGQGHSSLPLRISKI